MDVLNSVASKRITNPDTLAADLDYVLHWAGARAEFNRSIGTQCLGKLTTQLRRNRYGDIYFSIKRSARTVPAWLLATACHDEDQVLLFVLLCTLAPDTAKDLIRIFDNVVSTV